MPQGISIATFLWSTLEKFGGILIAFLLNLVLARFFLTPHDYGLIGMINIFISIANTTAIAGFGQAIIQSKEIKKEDYNTAFTFNLLVGGILYLVLFFVAPLIAAFFREPLLVNIVRVLALVLIINGFFIVQHSVLVRNMHFKRLSFISITSLGTSAILSVVLAANGWGVWTLVTNTLVASLLQTVLMYHSTEIKTKLYISKESFIKLFSFGGFMYLSTLLEVIQTNVLNLILGKKFSPHILGYYTQAEKLQNVPSSTLSAIVNQVTFPMFSKMQHNLPSIKEAFLSNIYFLGMLSTSLMGFFAIIAPALIILLFSDKWEVSVYIFQILCIIGIFSPLNSASTNVIKSLGKGKLFFYLQLWKSIGGIIILLIVSIQGFYPLLYSLCGINVLFYIVNVFVVNRLIKISLLETLILPIRQGIPGGIAFISCQFLFYIYPMKGGEYLIAASSLYSVVLLTLLEISRNKEYMKARREFTKILKNRNGM